MNSVDLTTSTEGAAAHGATRDRRRRLTTVLLLVSLGWFAQGSRAIWEPDEGRYTAVALQMIRTGDWIAPRLNHEVLHFTKPPLVYWLIAGTFETFGINELSARLPNALAWLALVFMLTSLARRLAPQRPLLTPVIWCSSLLPFVAVNIVTTDFILTAAECFAVLGFVAWWKDQQPSRLYWMWLGFALAFLVKGPPGLIPLLPILAFVAIERLKIREVLFHRSVALFFLVGFSWYLIVINRRPDVLDYWLGAEIAGRVSGAFNDRNGGPFGWLEVYGPIVVAAMLPWAALAPLGRWRRMFAESEDRFLLLWILLPLAVFLLSSSRMPLYLLPLTVPSALLLSRHLPSDLTERHWFAPAAVAWIALLGSLRIGAAYYPSGRDPREMADAIRHVASPVIEEVHFVDTNGWYGLTFYMGVEVEQVAMLVTEGSNPAYQSVWDRLNDEFREDAGDAVVYVVPETESREFNGELAERGLTARTNSFRGRSESFIVFGSLRKSTTQVRADNRGGRMKEPEARAPGPS